MKKSLTTLLFALVAIMMPIGAWAQNAEITDVTVSVDGVTYGSGDTAVITPTTTSILFTVAGKNFSQLNESNVLFLGCASVNVMKNYGWQIDTVNNRATSDFIDVLHLYQAMPEIQEILFTNDGKVSWIGTGICITYRDGEAPEQQAIEALWGASADQLNHSGTLAEAIKEAANNPEVKYIQLQADVQTTIEHYIVAGVFTLDLNGYTLSNSGYTIDIRYEESDVTIVDSSTQQTGKVISDCQGCAAVSVSYGAKLTITAGYYESPSRTIDVGIDSSITITGGKFVGVTEAVVNAHILNVSGGEFVARYSTVTADFTAVSTTISGGKFAPAEYETIDLQGGILDLSTYATEPNDATTPIAHLRICNRLDSAIVGKEVVLPAGYYMYDMNREQVSELEVDKYYTINNTTPAPTQITGISLSVDGVVYGAGDTARITPNTTSLVYTVTGDNFVFLNGDQILFDRITFAPVTKSYNWDINYETNTATLDISDNFKAYEKYFTPLEVNVSNDGQDSWIETGLYVVYQRDVDVLWGAHENDLFGGGTLQEAINAAKNDGVGYLQLQRNVEASNLRVDGGNFVLDLNGYTLSANTYLFYIYNPDTYLIVEDNSANQTGKIESTMSGGAIFMVEGGRVIIRSGTFIGNGYVSILRIQQAGSAEIVGGYLQSEESYAINNSGLLLIGGGVMESKSSNALQLYSGTAIIMGGTYTTPDNQASFRYNQGVINFSDYPTASSEGTTPFTELDFIYHGETMAYNDSLIALPDGYYVMKDGQIADTLNTLVVYTFGTGPRATITDMRMVVDGVEYSRGDTAVLYPNLKSIVLEVSGTNFAYLQPEHYVHFAPEGWRMVSKNYRWQVDEINNVARIEMISESNLFYAVTEQPFELSFKNDNIKWIGSGIHYIYDPNAVVEKEEPTITGLTITVDGVTYGVGDTAIITPNTASLSITVTGEHFDLINEYTVCAVGHTPSKLCRLASSTWKVDTVNNTATRDFMDEIDAFTSRIEPYQVDYSNDGREWIKSGVYVVYQYPRLEGSLAELVGEYDAYAQSAFPGAPDEEWQVSITLDKTDSTKLWITPVFMIGGLQATEIQPVCMQLDSATGYLALPMGQTLYETADYHMVMGTLDANNGPMIDTSVLVVPHKQDGIWKLHIWDLVGAGDILRNGWWYQGLSEIVYTQRNSISTDVEHISGSSATSVSQKILRDGQIIIQRDGVEYDVMGCRR